MANFLLNLIYSLTAELGSVVSHIRNSQIAAGVGQIFSSFFTGGKVFVDNTASSLIWNVEKFVIGILDAFEYMVDSFLGVGRTLDDFTDFANSNVMETFMRSFKAVVGVSIVLMIIFTIFAIIKQEWMMAQSDTLTPDKNNKGPIIMRLFRSIATIVILPISVLLVIGGVNSVLTSFNRALKGKYDATIGANVLATASYNSNKFKLYAEKGNRIPITIQAYNPSNYKPDEKDELVYNIKSSKVQNQLRSTIQTLADDNYRLSFKDSLSYENNKLTNSSKYGDIYETFICTPEQYQVLAEFTDFAELTQSGFYIRAMNDEFVNWKYVDATIYNKEDQSLTINYIDASDLDDDGSVKDTYSITYSLSYDVSSPIGDALDTIKALLGQGEYSDKVYNEMERQEDSVNVVQWANKKVSVHFSKYFDRDNPLTWTPTDEIIMYEYYHFDSNNTFSKYKIEDFYWDKAINEKDPVTLDAYIYTYRRYYEYADAYSPEIDVDCVLINGNYYITELSEEEEDELGNPYYVLKQLGETNFLTSTYTTIFEMPLSSAGGKATARIKFSKNFDLNNPNSWSYTDQIIAYEYYKDLSYSNELSKYPISQFSTTNGLELPVYVISLHGSLTDVTGKPQFFTKINGVFYQVEHASDGNYYTLYAPKDGDKDFIQGIGDTDVSKSFFNYSMNLPVDYGNRYGISTEEESHKTAEDFMIVVEADASKSEAEATRDYFYFDDDQEDETLTEDGRTVYLTKKKLLKGALDKAFKIETDEEHETFNLKFSTTFDYKDVGTWSFRDYFIFYLYAKYLAPSGVTVSQLKTDGGIRGEIGRIGIVANDSYLNKFAYVSKVDDAGKDVEYTEAQKSQVGITQYMYVYKIDTSLTNGKTLYLKIDDILNISELNVLNVLDVENTYLNNNFDKAYENNLIVEFSQEDKLEFSRAETENKVFTFSKDVIYSNINSWTIGDFLLFMLHDAGIIHVEGIEGDNFADRESTYKEHEQVALVYNQLEETATTHEPYKFYQFGSLFLSESYITQTLGYASIDAWWKTNLLNYISNQYKTGDSTGVVVDDTSISSGVYNSDYSKFVYGNASIINKFISQYVQSVKERRFEILNNITNYSYFNEKFDENDVSTWTLLDGIIYYIDGAVSKKTYSFELAYKFDANRMSEVLCIVFDNRVVELSTSAKSDLGLSLVSEFIISSTNSATPNTPANLTADQGSIDGDSNLIVADSFASYTRIDNATYTYTFAPSGNSELTELDLLLIRLSKSRYSSYFDFSSSLTNNKKINFEVYSDGGNTGDYYIKLSKNGSDKVIFYKFNSFSPSAIIQLSTNAEIRCDASKTLFTKKSDTYTPFGPIYSTSENNIRNFYTVYDAIIYNRTNGTNPTPYQVYSLGGLKDYILVEGDFVEYDTSYLTAAKGFSSANFTNISGSETPDSVIKKLYDDQYSQYFLGAPSVNYQTAESIQLSQINEVKNFRLETLSTWTPFNVILYSLGLIDSNGQVTGETDSSFLSGDMNYIKIDVYGSSVETYTIQINNILTVTQEANEDGGKIVSKFDTNMMVREQLILNLKNGYFIGSTDETNLLTVGTQLLAKFSSYIKSRDLITNENKNSFENKMSFEDVSSWNWFEIIYYYLFGKFPTSSYDYYVCGNDGDKIGYIKLTDGFYTYYLKYNSILSQHFTNTQETINVNFSLQNEEISAASIIYYVNTRLAQGQIAKFTMPDTGKEIWYFNGGGTNYYVYELTANPAKLSSSIAKYDVGNDSVHGIGELTVLDIYLRSIDGSLTSNSNSILNLNGSNYLFVNNLYLNLTKIDVTITGGYIRIPDTNYLVSDKIGYIKNKVISTPAELEFALQSVIIEVDEDNKKDLIKQQDSDSSLIEGADDGALNVKLNFSAGFDFSDYTTWKLSDFILYYIFMENYINYDDGNQNFQKYVTRGYVDATFLNISIIDEYNNVRSFNVLLIGKALTKEEFENLSDNSDRYNYTYVDYDIFYDLYDKILSTINTLNYSESDAVLKMTDLGVNNDEPTLTKFGITLSNNINSQDFKYNEYVYYEYNSDAIDGIFNYYGIHDLANISAENMSADSKLINLKLSDGFDPNKPSTWTILDYIIIYEFTRNVNNNVFEELTYDGLKSTNFFVELVMDNNGTIALLNINGNTYNLSYWCEDNKESNANFELKKGGKFTMLTDVIKNEEGNDIIIKDANGSDVNITAIIQRGEVVKLVDILKSAQISYNIKLLMNTLRFNLLVPITDVTKDFSETRVNTAIYYRLKEKSTGKEIIIRKELYNEETYNEDEYDILDMNYTIEDGQPTQEDYVINYTNGKYPRIELLQTANTLNYTVKDVLVSLENINSPIVVNVYAQIENTKNGEKFYISYEDFGQKYEAANDGSGTYKLKGSDGNVRYKIVEDWVFNPRGSYNSTDLEFYRLIDSNVYFNYQISLTRYTNYTISPNILKVNWPQKLLNDMMVIYPDLNWSTLLATDGWIDTLGDYHSGTASGNYLSSGNSANITAVGMVLSEFFLSAAKEAEGVNNYAYYSYETIFDEKTIKALMLSILGEENYEALYNEAKVFVDLFNTGFATILDDVAYERNINIKDGKVDNLTIGIYKSYLATAILSSDLAEYLYTIATRVLSQYTIYESLAMASGDYAKYYAYFTGQTDEDGNPVDAFAYGDFYELVKYENSTLRKNAIPLFTFNYDYVYDQYMNKKHPGEEKNPNIEDEAQFNEVNEFLDQQYSTKYLTNVNEQNSYSDKDTMYCYLYHVYYAIKQTLKLTGNVGEPRYLSLYKDFLEGNYQRWPIMREATLAGASVNFQNYGTLQGKLAVSKANIMKEFINSALIPLYSLGDLIGDALSAYGSAVKMEAEVLSADEDGLQESADELESRLKSIADGLTNIQTVRSVLEDICEDNAKYMDKIDILMDINIYNLFQMYIDCNRKDGCVAAWTRLNDNYKFLETLLNELSELYSLEPGQKTENSCKKPEGLEEKTLDEVYDRLSNWYNALGSYISIQKIIDSTMKASLTFTLAQYSNNYVEEGFDFTLNNSVYRMKTSVSTQRLGEYVYGGEFLERFGVPATYTSSGFQGIVDISTAYDNRDGFVKKKLESFTHLRKFASRLADYTGKFYLLSNMMDMSANDSYNSAGKYNNKDSILLTDYLYAANPYPSIISGNYIQTTEEYLIYDYIIENKYLSYDTIRELLVVDGSDVLSRCSENLSALADTQEFTSLSDDKKKELLREYLLYIQTTTVTTDDPDCFYGYPDSSRGYVGEYTNINTGLDAGENVGKCSSSDRIHEAFKKLILYITNSVEDDSNGLETEYEGMTISFENMYFQKLKAILMDALINFVKNESDTGEQTTNKYLTIFYLISSEFDYFYSTADYSSNSISSSSERELGREVARVNNTLIKNGDAVVGYTSYGEIYSLRARFRTDRTTTGLMLRLAGLENRPIEELVNRQYTMIYTDKGFYDEALGDTFILCTFSEEDGMYYPILARNRNFSYVLDKKSTYYEYLDDDNCHPVDLETKYYDAAHAYPIIAKGIMIGGGSDPDLLPTAIRIEDGEVIYYRDGVVATGNLDSGSLTTGTIVSEVSTLNYIHYVPYSTFSGYGDINMYISANNPAVYVESDMSVYFVQYTTKFNLEAYDDHGQIVVVDQFTGFYNMDTVFHLLMFLGFVTMLPILFKALLVAMRRILDLMAIILVGPLAISMNSLQTDDNGKSKAYSTWMDMFTKSVLSVFGIIISFNLYYILVHTALCMTYVTDGDPTMQLIAESPLYAFKDAKFLGLNIGGIVSAGFLNNVIKFLFVIVASQMIQSAANMLGKIITGNRVNNSFASGITETEPIQDMTNMVKGLVKDVKGAAGFIGKLYSGELLLDAKAAALEAAKSAIPGSAVLRRVSGFMQDKKAARKGKSMAKEAMKHGVSEKAAKYYAKQYAANAKKIRLAKSKKNLERANAFNKTFGMNEFNDVNKGVQAKDAEKQKTKMDNEIAKQHKREAKEKRKKEEEAQEAAYQQKKAAKRSGASNKKVDESAEEKPEDKPEDKPDDKGDGKGGGEKPATEKPDGGKPDDKGGDKGGEGGGKQTASGTTKENAPADSKGKGESGGKKGKDNEGPDKVKPAKDGVGHRMLAKMGRGFRRLGRNIAMSAKDGAKKVANYAKNKGKSIASWAKLPFRMLGAAGRGIKKAAGAVKRAPKAAAQKLKGTDWKGVGAKMVGRGLEHKAKLEHESKKKQAGAPQKEKPKTTETKPDGNPDAKK